MAQRPTTFLVDTDIFIDYLNGVKRMREILDSPNYRAYYSRVTRKELLAKPGLSATERRRIHLLLQYHRQIPVDGQIAENLSSWRARKYLSDVIGEMADVVRRLATIGFTHFVISADHGHVLVHEIPPGDIVPKPSGEWLKVKRRSLLGRALSTGPGVVVFKARDVGIQGDPEEICVPRRFKVFSAGDSYFHEGISLQEATVPVVVVHVRGSVASQGKREIAIRYRSDRFTSRVIGLKVEYTGLAFGEPVRVRIEAYDGPSPKAKRAGEAADCEARDERTHEVTLEPGKEIPVPVLIDPDFSGSGVEIRAIDPQTGVVWAKCGLKNALLD